MPNPAVAIIGGGLGSAAIQSRAAKKGWSGARAFC